MPALSRRRLLPFALAALAAPLLAAAASAAPVPAGKDLPYASADLVAKARKEGRLTLYTANWADDEQALAKAFNALFPEIQVEIVRLPGGQLFTRIQSEAAAGKLAADVIDLSDRGQALSLKGLYADYAPPNAADYRADGIVGPNLWPRTVWGWAIAYNAALVKDPPRSWRELAEGRFGGGLGHTIPAAGGAPWTAVMFERKVLGDGYWEKLAAQKPLVTPSSPQLNSALIRGEVRVAPLLTNGVVPNAREGAPIRMVLPPEGVPIAPSAAGIPKSAAHPNAARLFLGWSLSEEGQRQWIESRGGFSMLRNAPLPDGVAGAVPLWLPDFTEFDTLREPWTREWNALFGYNQ